MLRRTLHIVLAALLLVLTTEVSLSMHYCCGKLVSTSINKAAKSCCDGTGGCCENKTIHFEVEDDYVSPLALENIPTVELDVLFPVLFALYADVLPEVETATVYFNDTSPPPLIQTRLSLLQTYLC